MTLEVNHRGSYTFVSLYIYPAPESHPYLFSFVFSLMTDVVHLEYVIFVFFRILVDDHCVVHLGHVAGVVVLLLLFCLLCLLSGVTHFGGAQPSHPPMYILWCTWDDLTWLRVPRFAAFLRTSHSGRGVGVVRVCWSCPCILSFSHVSGILLAALVPIFVVTCTSWC